MSSLTRDQLREVIAETHAYWQDMSEEDAVRELEPVIRILLKKDHDYGPGNLYKTGLVGIMVRMLDKVTRIERLDGRQALVLDESTLDTVYDLIGYALRYLIIQKEQVDSDSAAQ